MKLEHIGIAIKNLEESKSLFNELLNTQPYKEELVESEGVQTTFYQTGESKIELLNSTNPNSAIAKFIDKKGEGIHHLAFEVEDIVQEVERLKGLGYTIINDAPKKGADNKLITFLHPKSTNGVLVELCQTIQP